jgi:hypothetical protein
MEEKDLKGFPKPLRSLKNGRIELIGKFRAFPLIKNCGNGVMD